MHSPWGGGWHHLILWEDRTTSGCSPSQVIGEDTEAGRGPGTVRSRTQIAPGSTASLPGTVLPHGILGPGDSLWVPHLHPHCY